MVDDWQSDLSHSARDFADVVWLEVGRWCGDGQLEPVELHTDDGMAATLDQLAGIDGWQIVDTVGVRGIASRVQYGRPWASFTVRETRTSGAETELEKRLRALAEPERGWLSPTLTVQAYIDAPGGTLLYACMCYSRDLYEHIRDTDLWERRTNPDDQNTFIVVWVDDLIAAGRRVEEHDSETAPVIRGSAKART